MATLNLSNFSPGLDTRRSELTSKPGVLETLQNAHINPGGEVEKRKALVPIYLPSGSDYTFGLQPTVTNLVVFGSHDPVFVPVLPAPVIYQRLISPNTGSPNITKVISSTLFQNAAFVVAQFADNYNYVFYNGTLVPDFTNGLVLSWQNTINQIAAAIATMTNFTGSVSNTVTGELIYTAVATNNMVNITATPNINSGGPFTVNTSLVLGSTSTGTIVSDLLTSGVASTAAVQATGSFAILQGTAASGFATGSATINNLSAYNGTPNTADIVTIGSNTYYFATSAYLATHPSDPFAVLVGGSTGASATNLAAAINGTGTPGVTYGNTMTINTQLSAVAAGSVVNFTALQSGTPGNSVPTAYVSNNHATYTFAGTTLSGGTNSSYISSVNVNGNNILSAQIPWDQTQQQTAIDVAININANSNANGGFTATANGGVVTIYSLLTNAAIYNIQTVSVVVVGQIIVTQMSFNISACTNATTITGITVGATTITTGTITSSGTNTLTFGGQIATNIIGTGNGYTALAVAVNSTVTTVFVSPLTSSSATTLGNMVVTEGGSGGTFGNSTSPTLVLNLSSYSIAGFSTYSSGFKTVATGVAVRTTTYITNSVTAQASGGVPPYTYKWQYAGSASTQLVAQYKTLATTAWFFTTNVSNVTEQWTCTVTDSASSMAVSQPLNILF